MVGHKRLSRLFYGNLQAMFLDCLILFGQIFNVGFVLWQQPELLLGQTEWLQDLKQDCFQTLLSNSVME